MRKSCGCELDKACKCEDQQNPLEGHGMPQRMESATRPGATRTVIDDKWEDQNIGLGNTAIEPPEAGIVSGQPEAKIPATPGKSGSSEVFRTTVGQIFPPAEDGSDDNLYRCLSCNITSKTSELALGYTYIHKEPFGVSTLTKEGFSTKFYSHEIDLHCAKCNGQNFERIK